MEYAKGDKTVRIGALRLVLAILLPVVACGVQWLLWNKISPFVWFLFFPTVFFSAWLGGMAGGLASTVISTALVWYFFIHTQLSWSVTNPNHFFSVALFVVMGGFFSLTFALLKKANRRAEEALSSAETANLHLEESNQKISSLYEKTKEIDELKTQFFANVSHELRTPLALILGPISKWLKNDDFKDQNRSELEIVERNARLLYRQVNDLLDVAKLEAGRMTMRYAQTDLAHQVRLIASHFIILAEERSINFSVEADTAVSAQIDIEKFHRIALNLLSNAFKFTPDHGVIRVSLKQSGDQAVIMVQDTGRGIPEDKREIIFESFRQVDGASNRQYGGTGLGLSIVKEFVSLHGGTVAVDNVPGGGALFTVTLPTKAPSDKEVLTEEAPLILDDNSMQLIEELRTVKVPGVAHETSQNNDQATVLVVEDNSDMNSFICSILQPHYRVISAYNGNDGLQAALDSHPNLILSDIMMPGMSGDAMVEEIRSHSELENIPIILLTAKADDDLQIKMLKSGITDYIRKPFLPDELLARVAVVLSERLESRKKLHLSEDRYASLVKASPTGIFQTDREGNCLYVNERWCAITGMSQDDAMGSGWTSTLHPDDRQHVFNTWNHSVAHNVTFNLEYRFQHPNGKIMWVFGQAVATTDLSGETTGYVGTITDITDRKQAVIDLKHSHELLSYVIQHNQSALAVHDRNMRYLYVSQRYLDDYKVKNTDIIGKHHYDVFPDLPQKWRDVHKKALAGEVCSEKEDSYERADGSVDWTRWECRPWFEPDGTIGGIIIYTEVITERKRQEIALRDSETKFRMLVKNLSSGVVVHASDSSIIFANPMASTLLGLSNDQMMGKTAIDPDWCFVRENGTPMPLEEYPVNQVLNHGKPLSSFTLGVCRPDLKNPLWVLCNAYPIESPEGLLQQVVVVFSDITLLKNAEAEKLLFEQQIQQTQKLESLGVLSGGIAHDFNNILAIIMGYCSLTKMDYEDAEKHIPEIEKAAERAAGLCRQMLAYAGKAQLTKTQINMWMLVDEMVTMLKSTLPQNAVIKPELATNVPFIDADASQLRQIVMNLIINASEAIGDGHGEIKVSLATTAIKTGQSEQDYNGNTIPPGEYVCLEVTDNGCGMDEETKWRIFEPFYTTKFTGRGLGMSAVLGIIKSHGGALQLHSQLGQGTTFKVYLPVPNKCSNEDDGQQQSIPSAAWHGSGTILLVEDEDQVRHIAKALLKNIGFTVLEAVNGKDALEKYQKNATDITLVMTDMGMPIMDGYELFSELKNLNPELPIIVSSGYGDAEVSSRLGTDNIAGVISKPYGPDQLREVLKRALESTLMV